MPKYVRIDEEDYLWMKKLLNNWLASDPNGPILQINYIHIYNWHNALEDAKDARNIKSDTEVPDELVSDLPPKKLRAKSGKSTSVSKGRKGSKQSKKVKEIEEVPDPYECPDHKTYKAKYVPRGDCAKCWSLYKQMHPMDYPAKRAAFERKLSRPHS